MTNVQIFLMVVLWVSVAVVFFITLAHIDYTDSKEEKKLGIQMVSLWAVQLILAVIASCFHFLLLPLTIAGVVIMILAIILAVRKEPVELKEFLKQDELSVGEAGAKAKKVLKKPIWKILGLLLLIGALGWGAFTVTRASFVKVNPGERAIKRYFGEVEPQSYGPGLVWYIPFSQDWGNEVIVVNTRPKTFDYHSVIRTKEQLKASIYYSVTCQINEERVHVMYNKYTDIDNYKSVKIDHMMPSIMMLLTSKMSFWSLSDETSSLVTEAAQYILNDQLGADSLVAITNFYFKGYQASAEIEAKIEQIAQAHQNIELEQLKLQMAKIETEKVREEAQQTYERMAAVAKANGIEIEILNKNITNPLIAQYRVAKALEEAASKWDGSINTPNALTIMKSAGENGGGISPSIFPIMPINTK